MTNTPAGFAALLLLASTASATPVTDGKLPTGKGRFQICMMPFGCGATGRSSLPRLRGGEKKNAAVSELPPSAITEIPASRLYEHNDPLAQPLGGEITSVIRLSPEQSASGKSEVIVIRRSAGDLALPDPEIQLGPEAKGAASKDIDPLAIEGDGSGQANETLKRTGLIDGSAEKRSTGAGGAFGTTGHSKRIKSE